MGEACNRIWNITLPEQRTWEDQLKIGFKKTRMGDGWNYFWDIVNGKLWQ
jgi:hypothetical protein